MLFQRFVSEGLSHYSYLIGDQDVAAVVDPRRDCEAYIEAALQEGMRIQTILETHRNEDYVVGSMELARRTGAIILHSAHGDLEYKYGQPVRDGELVTVGRLVLRALHTPGHTLGHMSYVLYDLGGAVWMVFTGDALFAGEVGRTDFLGKENLAQMTGLLFDSLFDKLLPLGDGVLVCPAHGAGSVCGSGIADRPWTTIGLERRHNPRLRHTSREEFIRQVGRVLPVAPYMHTMERLNLEGAPVLGTWPVPSPLSPHEFAARAGDAQIVDVRPLESFSTAHVPGAIALWKPELPAYAGWFLTYDKPVLLVGGADDVSDAVRYLVRMGFDRIEGSLAGGMLAWHRSGFPSQGVHSVAVQELCRRLDTRQDPWILDVRSPEEIAQQAIPGAHAIHIKEIATRLEEVPRNVPVYVFCGSGVRSMIGASVLGRAGWRNLVVVLGGLTGWNSVSCPLRLG